MDEDWEVGGGGEVAFAGDHGIAFPSDGKLVGDVGDEWVVGGCAEEDEVATLGLALRDFAGFLEGQVAPEEFPPALLEVGELEGALDGALLGEADGASVGASVGDSVGLCWHCPAQYSFCTVSTLTK